MRELHELIDTVGPSDATVLIMGESGTGKELAARALHRNSPRAGKPLVKLSCAALPESLLEGELFGHEKGAFTDAKERRPGRFELADGGTIFLDDIDDMSLPTQVKLLRVLQEREFERVGGTKTVKVDVRVIVATKVDLSLLAQDGKFRDDLYFRLNVVTLRLPPLRERLEDIPALIRHFCRRHGGDRLYHVDPETLTEMAAYPWPGNVRELENAVLRAITMAGKAETLEKRHLLQAPAAMNGVSAANARQADQGRSMSLLSGMARQTSGNPSSTPTGTVEAVASPSASGTEPTFRTLKEVLSEAERAHIKRVLNFTQNNRSRAAEILGISRKNLWEKMKDFGDKSEP
jgi:DNA-binding NtrC family response regulator